jgi:MFS superfamily sulfate permease-like transporter
LLPVADWLPRYDRSWLRGDLTAGIAVTALIVPKNLGYAGIAGVPIENGLYAAAAGAIIYALFCTSRQISTGPSSGLAAVAGGAVLVTKLGGQEGGGARRGDHPSHGRPVPAACTVSDGVDRAVPVEGGDHRVSCRRRDRRDDW